MTKSKQNSDAVSSEEINENIDEDIAFLKDEEAAPDVSVKEDVPKAEEAAESVPKAGYDALNEKYQALNEKYQALNDAYLRLRADFDNYKKRTQKEKSDVMRYASCELVTKLLNILDNFERAIAASEEDTPLASGVKMVYKQLYDILKEEGLDVIACVGEPFDPNMHHAVLTGSEQEKEENIITEELQRGYIYKEKVIRPSMVKVNKH
jgi:molecular chaperone GrpE